MADLFGQWLALSLANADASLQGFTVLHTLHLLGKWSLVFPLLATATCVLQQAQTELEGVLTDFEMYAAAVEPLAFVGQPQACLFNRSVPFAHCLNHGIAQTVLSTPTPPQEHCVTHLQGRYDGLPHVTPHCPLGLGFLLGHELVPTHCCTSTIRHAARSANPQPCWQQQRACFLVW